ncbi:15-hydroxyprostaglandin dehydrogenase [NAD(+)] [Manduca sexta]|uniref:Alcohol dehydrogenase n=1 Tax=Manduca sexta TaxID=7130 RepID=A0A922CNL7_MANSE|nr:15-hydroxyprostaglandin dehydrogenase [NAD(+)] [Manduca sexta]KAG6452917.1 hypothetical protein O3G_MSEX007867 [Manduca sexta]
MNCITITHCKLVHCTVNMFDLKHKIVLLTGGANGIGAAIVQAFLREGVKHIAILDIDVSSGNSLENEMNETYGDEKVKYYQCDVSKDEQLLETFNIVHDRNSYIDIVINNAGLTDESNTSNIRSEIEVNYIALVNGTLKALEMMRVDRGGRGGTVINISSIACLCQLAPALFVYLGTKSAVLQFSNCIGREEYYTKTGVRVITVCFGNTDTTIMQKLKSFDEEINKEMQEIIKLYPMQSQESAAKGVVDVLKNGKSGSTWLVANDKPAVDYSSHVTDAYKIMAKHLND